MFSPQLLSSVDRGGHDGLVAIHGPGRPGPRLTDSTVVMSSHRQVYADTGFDPLGLASRLDAGPEREATAEQVGRAATIDVT